MQRQYDIRQVLHAQYLIIRLVGVDMNAGGQYFHLHGPNSWGWVKVIIDNAKSGYGSQTALRIYKHSKRPRCMGRRVKNPDTVDNLKFVPFDYDYSPGILDGLDKIELIPEVQRLRVVYPFHLELMGIECGIRALDVILAVIVVQMRVDYDIDIGWRKSPLREAFLEGVDLSAYPLFPLLRGENSHERGINKDFLIASLEIPYINGDVKFGTVTVLVGHNAFVDNFTAYHNRMNLIRSHSSPSLSAQQPHMRSLDKAPAGDAHRTPSLISYANNYFLSDLLVAETPAARRCRALRRFQGLYLALGILGPIAIGFNPQIVVKRLDSFIISFLGA